MNQFYSIISTFMPEVVLVVGAMLAISFDILSGGKKSHDLRVGVAAFIGAVAIVAAGVVVWRMQGVPQTETFLAHNYPTSCAKLAILALSGLTMLLIGGTSRQKNPAEHVALTLFATAGLTLMAAADNLLVIFLAFELASLSLYILAGFDKTSPASAEAGLKYFLFGSMASAFLLFGFSLIYGLTGELDLLAIGEKMATTPFSPLLMIAIIMVFVGFGYKAAAAPFHLWAPDVYQGAPATSAALIASASKVAGFVLLARFTIALESKLGSIDFAGSLDGWFGVLAALVAASLLTGNIVALAQQNVRSLLAYSAIGHAGVLLLATRTVQENPELLLYYALTYGIATVGVFGIIAVLENNGGVRKLSDLIGLWKRSPLLSLCLMVCVLSLAGIPPLAGFYAKFSVFAKLLFASNDTRVATADNVIFWLVLLAIAMSAVALYYYLQILKNALVVSSEDEKSLLPIRVPFLAGLALILCSTALIALGVCPKLVF